MHPLEQACKIMFLGVGYTNKADTREHIANLGRLRKTSLSLYNKLNDKKFLEEWVNLIGLKNLSLNKLPETGIDIFQRFKVLSNWKFNTPKITHFDFYEPYPEAFDGNIDYPQIYFEAVNDDIQFHDLYARKPQPLSALEKGWTKLSQERDVNVPIASPNEKCFAYMACSGDWKVTVGHLNKLYFFYKSEFKTMLRIFNKDVGQEVIRQIEINNSLLFVRVSNIKDETHLVIYSLETLKMMRYILWKPKTEWFYVTKDYVVILKKEDKKSEGKIVTSFSLETLSLEKITSQYQQTFPASLMPEELALPGNPYIVKGKDNELFILIDKDGQSLSLSKVLIQNNKFEIVELAASIACSHGNGRLSVSYHSEKFFIIYEINLAANLITYDLETGLVSEPYKLPMKIVLNALPYHGDPYSWIPPNIIMDDCDNDMVEGFMPQSFQTLDKIQFLFTTFKPIEEDERALAGIGRLILDYA